MWCRQCQQDVPAVSTHGRLGCPRCGERFRATTPQAATSTEPKKPEEPAATATGADEWEVDEQLRDIGEALGTRRSDERRKSTAYRREAARFDLPHNGPAGWHRNLPATNGAADGKRSEPAAERGKRSRPSAKSEAKTGNGGLGGLAWLALLIGTMGFVCGGALLGWSLITGRQELWTVGLPVALGGQIALLVGLILQIERLWHDNRRSADRLENVDAQLHDLKTSTTLLGTTYTAPATQFYSHFAHGASPEVLLTDLKSQLDLLALRVSQQHDE